MEDDGFEARLSRRLRAFADDQTALIGPPEFVGERTRSVWRSRTVGALSVAAALLLAVGAGLGASALLSDGSSIGVDLGPSQSAAPSPSGSLDPGASPTAAATALETASPTPSPAPPSVEPAATAAPLAGEIPPADAQPPAGIYYVDGLQATDVWNTLTTAGYACTSQSGMGLEDPSLGWTIRCERTIAGMRATVSAPYWTLQHVVGVFMTALPEPVGGSIEDPRLVVAEATRLARFDYEGADPGAAASWLAQSLADTRCAETPCQADFGQARLSVQLGEGGSRVVMLDGRAVTP